MKILYGMIFGVVLTLSLQYGWKYFRYREYKDDAALFEIAKYDLEHKLTGVRVLDIAIYPNSTVKVNYAYDKLYDVDMNYERDGRIKK
jgi:hypothetical protein